MLPTSRTLAFLLYRRLSVKSALQFSPLLEVGIVGIEVLTSDVLKQARNTHLTTSEFANIIFMSVPYLATDKYRLAVNNSRDFQIGIAVLLQRELALLTLRWMVGDSTVVDV